MYLIHGTIRNVSEMAKSSTCIRQDEWNISVHRLTFSSTTCSNSELSDPTLLKLTNQDITGSRNWNGSAQKLSVHNDV